MYEQMVEGDWYTTDEAMAAMGLEALWMSAQAEKATAEEAGTQVYEVGPGGRVGGRSGGRDKGGRGWAPWSPPT